MAEIDLEYLEKNFASLPPDVQNAVRDQLVRLKGGNPVTEARENFLAFVRRVWPGYIHGRHHDVMAEAFERIEKGELKRCIINMPPRSTKSRFTEHPVPGVVSGPPPGAKIFEARTRASLAGDFGRDLRNLVRTEPYQEVFPGVILRQDSRAAHRWNTSQGGEYFAIGKTGGAAGKGGDLVVIDDPHSEQDVLKNQRHEFAKTWNWYLAGPRQRLQPGAAILVVMTRWGAEDLTGQLIKQYTETDEELERWEVIELPAILPSGEALFPGFWTIKELLATKATMPTSRWMANYQQSPVSRRGGDHQARVVEGLEQARAARLRLCGAELGHRVLGEGERQPARPASPGASSATTRMTTRRGPRPASSCSTPSWRASSSPT